MTRVLAAILMIASFVVPCSASVTAAVDRPKVASIGFDYPGELPESLPGLVSVKPGDTYSPKSVRDSIRLIYLMGMFRDIVVDAEETPAGLALTFRLVPRKLVDDIEVVGDDELSYRKVVGAMSLKEGDYLDDKLLMKSRDGVRRLMADEGLPDGKVEILVHDIDALTSELVVVLKEGRPALVSDIRFEGKLAISEDELLGELEFGVGDVLKRAELDESLEAITALYVERNYVNVTVDSDSTTYGEGAAHVVIRVDSGPMLEVGFEGNEEFSDGKLRDRLSFWEDKDVSPENVTENLERLVEYYRDSGYYYAAITARTEESGPPARILVRFVIVEGPRASLEEINISGNAELDEDDIRDVMELSESSVFRSRPVTDRMFQEDVKRIKALYESRGYMAAEVAPSRIEFSDDGAIAHIAITIKEGPRTYIDDISFDGNEGLPADRLSALTAGGPGSPYSPQQVNEYRNSILNLYSQNGYIHATVEVQTGFSDDGGKVDLVFKINEGVPVTIGRVILRGNVDTRDTVILRELLFRPGGVYDYEKILRSQQRIFKLGFLSQVKIQPVNPDKVERVKDILVSVKERDAGAVEFGVGYGDFDLYRGSAEVSYSNLFGYGHRISARGELSARETKGILSYKWPWFGGWHLDFRSSLVYLDAEKPNYNIRDMIASAGFDKSFGEHLNTSIFYQYEKLKLDVPAGAVLAPEDRKKSNLASVSPSAVYDLRDNPFNATTGSVHALAVKWASSVFGSTVDFVKVTAQTSWYFPVYRKIVFGISARGGLEGWFSDKVEVPISERFFLGGASSLRGYSFESVSPRSPDGKPIGGDTMFLMNAELRFPLPYGFGLVGFIDAGNVWLQNKNATFTKEWKDKFGNDTQIRTIGGLRYGAGMGLRYDTPVGPLRLDYGFKLNKRGNESPGELHFTLGQAF